MHSQATQAASLPQRQSAKEKPNPGLPRSMRSEVRLLGRLLGQVIGRHRGDALVDRIEAIRALAKQARQGSDADWSRLSDYLSGLPEESLVDIARAFNQFLNLANIADQRHAALDASWPERIDLDDLAGIRIELVLTAHPTEVLRRTMIAKYDEIAGLLSRRSGTSGRRRAEIDMELERVISEVWRSDEIRRARPSPVDEARWGLSVAEKSLWHALPAAMRELDALGEQPVPLRTMPFAFSSWIGGDRDGNPNVTAAVTREVLLLSRWSAATLFLRDIENLIESLSMTDADSYVRARAGNADEPYRAVLKDLRLKLHATREWIEKGGREPSQDILRDDSHLTEPLELCFRSLHSRGMTVIAQGPLLDTLRRAHCFGLHLLQMDIRQHTNRHVDVLDQLTRYLDDTDAGFRSWDEPKRCAWLLNELGARRPLFPASWPADRDAQEVLDTFAVIAENEAAGISAYVISMAAKPSDVLAVALLLKAAGLLRRLPIVPLFETLAHLDQAAETMDKLLSTPWCRAYMGNHMHVMVGYSDSAKDGGQFAAAWAQYRAQERIAEVAQRHGVRLTLFHGRGGAIGRGGGPAAQAIRAQPPGSVAGSLRVTEQGEMVRFRLGASAIAKTTLSHYLSATLRATPGPPEGPSSNMRRRMDELAELTFATYASTLQDPRFLGFFRAFTAENELAALALGSRPASRGPARDINGMRAIHWVFAWTQVRLMLPAWLGTEKALACLEGGGKEEFDALRSWPFFAMQIDMLESILAKADPILARYYARGIVNAEQAALADSLIKKLEQLRGALTRLLDEPHLLHGSPEIRDSIRVRNTYLDPLHLLQAELLARRREGNESSSVSQALKVTMAGIASGLRSTG